MKRTEETAVDEAKTGKFPAVQPWKHRQDSGGKRDVWEHRDHRWVTLQLGVDDELGRVVVADSAGRRVLLDSYEDALALALSWRA